MFGCLFVIVVLVVVVVVVIIVAMIVVVTIAIINYCLLLKENIQQTKYKSRHTKQLLVVVSFLAAFMTELSS